MDSIAGYQTVFFFILVFCLALYTVLDGIDLGASMLLPFLAKDEEEKKSLLKSTAPLWDGNEAWLLIAGVVLYKAFPQVFSICLRSFLIPAIVVIVCLALRPLAYVLRFRDEKRKRLWEMVLAAASLVPVLVFFLCLGIIVQGAAIVNSRGLTLEIYQPFTFFSIMTCLAGLCAVLMQGAAWALLKAAGEAMDRALSAVQTVQWLYRGALIFFIASGVMGLSRGQTAKNLLYWVAIFVAFFSLILLRLSLKPLQKRLLLAISSAAALFFWTAIAMLQFPFLIRSLSEFPGMSIYNTSASMAALKPLLWIVLALIAALVSYTVWIFKAVRGKTGQI
jgi:cytochrome bd ubiquinol oxidase subunit II